MDDRNKESYTDTVIHISVKIKNHTRMKKNSTLLGCAPEERTRRKEKRKALCGGYDIAISYLTEVLHLLQKERIEEKAEGS